MKRTQSPSRRDFARSLALAAAAPLGLSPSTSAQEPKIPVPVRTSAEALLQILQARFGKFLNEKQMTEVAKRVLRQQFLADALRRVPVKNSDEPAFAFRADLP